MVYQSGSVQTALSIFITLPLWQTTMEGEFAGRVELQLVQHTHTHEMGLENLTDWFSRTVDIMFWIRLKRQSGSDY